MRRYLKHITKRRLLLVLIGFLAGAISLVAVRAVAYSPEYVHYHANFALYINGEREDFDSFTFYEEVQACGVGGNDPKSRVHMHNQENSLVHIHDEAATWGHFFANLGFGITKSTIETDRGVFHGQADEKLVFYLNGEEVDSIANRVIGDSDILLVDYGTTSSEEIQQRYEAIDTTAAEANTKPDPSTCSGNDEPTLIERLKFAVGLQATAKPGGHADHSSGHAH